MKTLTKDEIEQLYRGFPKDESGHVLAFGRSIPFEYKNRKAKRRELTLDDYGSAEYDRQFSQMLNRKSAPTQPSPIESEVRELDI
jgi:hypothetical protein